GDASLANSVTTTNTTLSIGGALTPAQGAAVALSTQGAPRAGDITVTGATNGTPGGASESLTLNARTGTPTLSGLSGAAGGPAATGLPPVTVTHAGATNFNGAVAITGALTQTNAATGATTFAGTVSVGSATLRGTTFDVQNGLTATGAVAVTNSGLFTLAPPPPILPPPPFSPPPTPPLA